MKNIYLTLVLESIYSVSRFKRIRRRRKKKLSFETVILLFLIFQMMRPFFHQQTTHLISLISNLAPRWVEER